MQDLLIEMSTGFEVHFTPLGGYPKDDTQNYLITVILSGDFVDLGYFGALRDDLVEYIIYVHAGDLGRYNISSIIEEKTETTDQG